jgi:hypothetical protein
MVWYPFRPGSARCARPIGSPICRRRHSPPMSRVTASFLRRGQGSWNSRLEARISPSARLCINLYVEQRELSPPITLDYPTFSAAARACGMSRIWAGVHWPADNEQGRELGHKVGENAWQRYQQFVLGFASPATAALMTLRPPFWFHETPSAAQQAGFAAAAGLAIDLKPDADGSWQSVVLDPMPAGKYELKLGLSVAGDAPIRLRTAIEPGDRGGTPFAAGEATFPATGAGAAMRVPWTSDGARPFWVTIAACSGDGGARVAISAIDLTRIWPVVAGSAALLRTEPRRTYGSVAATRHREPCIRGAARRSARSGLVLQIKQ